MTLAELVLLIAGAFGIYRLLAPLQRRLQAYLTLRFAARPPPLHLPTIDVTAFTSHPSSGEEERHR